MIWKVVSRSVGMAGGSCGVVRVEGVVWFGSTLQLGQVTCRVVLMLSSGWVVVACEMSGGPFEPITLLIAPIL